MLADIFSPVWLPVMSYIIFLRNKKIKKYFIHVSYIVFVSCFAGFFYPLSKDILHDTDIHFSLATSLVSSLVSIVLDLIIFFLFVFNRRSYERN